MSPKNVLTEQTRLINTLRRDATTPPSRKKKSLNPSSFRAFAPSQFKLAKNGTFYTSTKKRQSSQ